MCVSGAIVAPWPAPIPFESDAMTEEIRECRVCGDLFIAHHHATFICSDDCRHEQAFIAMLRRRGYDGTVEDYFHLQNKTKN